MLPGPGQCRPLFPVLGSRLQSPLQLALYLFLAVLFSGFVGLSLGKWGLPLIQAAAIFPLFCALVSRQQTGRALASMLLWAFLVAVSMSLLTLYMPSWAGGRILLGESYRDEMFDWIRSGTGRESNPALFIPQHLLHFFIFCLMTRLSGGFLGLLMGAILMNYMSFYVGSLLLLGEPGVLWLIAWPPWAAIRVVAFVICAGALSLTCFQSWGVVPAGVGSVRKWMFLAACLILADIVLKTLLAPLWSPWLKALTNL